MAVVISTPGTEPRPVRMYGECWRCGCRLNCLADDAKRSPAGFYWVKCPMVFGGWWPFRKTCSGYATVKECKR